MTPQASSAVFELARQSIYYAGDMKTSAQLCLKDAENLHNAGGYKYAIERSLKSILYSVGCYGPAYRRACAILAELAPEQCPHKTVNN